TSNKHQKTGQVSEETLKEKIDLPYLSDKCEVEKTGDFRSMYVYVNALKYKNNREKFPEIAIKLSRKCDIEYEKCLQALLADNDTLKHYSVELVYYCSVDSLRCHELMRKRNVIGDYIEHAKLSCMTISNVFMNGLIIIKKYHGGLVISSKMMVPLQTIKIAKIEKKIKKPVADLDFNSMYPNGIITKNISKEMIIKTSVNELDNSDYDTDPKLSVLERIHLHDLFDPNQDEIDILYYFQCLKDVIGSLLKTDSKKILKLIKDIYIENTKKTIQKLINFEKRNYGKLEEFESQKSDLVNKKQKLDDSNTNEKSEEIYNRKRKSEELEKSSKKQKPNANSKN
ncbi:5244_t:CDS:2, partial [Cetraspora pellucida]